MCSYMTVIPRRFILHSGRIVTLGAVDVEERITRETLFRLWVPILMMCIGTSGKRVLKMLLCQFLKVRSIV